MLVCVQSSTVLQHPRHNGSRIGVRNTTLRCSATLAPARQAKQLLLRSARKQEYWQIADVHCETFYPDVEATTLLGSFLRLDRVAALSLGKSMEQRAYGKYSCVVAEGDMDRVGSYSPGQPAALPRPPALIMALMRPEFKEGYELTSADGSLLGAIVVDNFGEHMPAKVEEHPGGTRLKRRKFIGYISNLAVCTDARRQGIGQALLEQAEQLARSWGCRSMALHVDPSNSAAYELYRRNGYKVVQEEPWWLRFLEGVKMNVAGMQRR